MAKINRNKERDKEEQQKLAKMGWHVIIIWECQLKPSIRNATLQSLAFTLNHIFLIDNEIKYPRIAEEQDGDMIAEPTP
jgi:DNA mismatch endonuclease (patch repair protein)